MEEAQLWNDVLDHVERELAPRRRPAQGHRADRDAAGGVRDGRDPACAAHAHRRPQLRALGLHVLVHQDLPRAPRQGAARARAGDDDAAVPEGLLGTADPDLPQARRARDGRHGRADPDQRRRRRQRGGAGQGARRQAARSHRRPRRHLGRAPGADPAGAADLRRAHAHAEPAPRAARGRVGHARRPDQAVAGHDHAAPVSRATSRSACATSPPGSTATAACRSTG